MSTSYDVPEPMTPEKAAEISGWTLEQRDDGQLLTDGKNYAHVFVFEWNGERYVSFERYGSNDVDALAELLDAVSEHESCWIDLPWNAEGLED